MEYKVLQVSRAQLGLVEK
jgi:hypothetical protein